MKPYFELHVTFVDSPALRRGQGDARMKTVDTSPLSGADVAKRLLFLAYQASGARGLGFLHLTDKVTEEELWSQQRQGDIAKCRVSADYLYGRMVKLWDFSFGPTSVTFDDQQTPRGDYQSWCGTYPTNESLVLAAIESLKVSK